MRRVALMCLLASAVGCRCEKVNTIKPSFQVSPTGIDFGPVKNGDGSNRSLKLEARTGAEVSVSKIELNAGTSPGGIEGFTVKLDPVSINGMGSVNLPVTFHPSTLQEYSAVLVFTSNDEEHPTIRVSLVGDGAKPSMVVTPDCAPARGCMGTVAVNPPSIDFGAEPFMRAVMIDASKLPAVSITNEGSVALVVSRLEIVGPDAAAFRIEGVVTTPLEYEPMAGVSVPIRFKPLSETQMMYSASLVIEGDDPDVPSVTVPLSGRLAPNLPPQVCANIVQITPMDGCSPRDYRPEWPQLLMVPMGGYDFRSSRPIEPRATVELSALSNPTNAGTCTTDAEDGRAGLTYLWTVISVPIGATGLGTSTTDRFQLTPIVEGDYTVQLAVTDTKSATTTVLIKFAVARREDLIVRLNWPTFAGIDLDVHLVRPSSTTAGQPYSGAFSYFNEGPVMKTSGDMNGYSKRAAAGNLNFNFEWGGVGTCDDPRLNIDDIGDSNLIEDVSLNNPENDVRCDGGRCAYKVFVHYFRDYRMAAMGSCFVDGGTLCSDGEQCACASGERCVATPPPDGGRPFGAGECRIAPKPVVRIFLKGSPTPAATIPLAPDEVVLGSPCAMQYVADVNWPSLQEIGSLPDGGTPLATVTDRTDAGLARFGRRQPGDLRQCSPDVSMPSQWYSQQP